MLTTNYYNFKSNNQLMSRAYTNSNGYPSNITTLFKNVPFKQLHYPDGSYNTGYIAYSYGYGDVLFDGTPSSTTYAPSGEKVLHCFAIGFDGSNTPASIDDYKLIEPILNCNIITTTFTKIDNKYVREFTIKNNNNTEITINGVGLFGSFGADRSNYSSGDKVSLPLLYREVFASSITVPSKSSFIYRLEITVGE